MAQTMNPYRRAARNLWSHGRIRGGLSRLGDSSSSPTASAQIPGLNTLPWTNAQKTALQARASAVGQLPPYLHPELTLFLPPADFKAFQVTPLIFPAFPAVGAPAIPIISYTAPQGCIAVINKLAIVYIGGSPPDGTGEVVWQVTVNGAGVKGLNMLTSQV